MGTGENQANQHNKVWTWLAVQMYECEEYWWNAIRMGILLHPEPSAHPNGLAGTSYRRVNAGNNRGASKIWGRMPISGLII